MVDLAAHRAPHAGAGRRAEPARPARPADQAAAAGPADRRQRLDGALRRRAAALRPRRRAGGTVQHRGLHARHPADPGDPGVAAAATPTARWPAPAGRSRTGAAAPGSATGCRRSWTAGASAVSPAGPSSCCALTAGSGATPPLLGEQLGAAGPAGAYRGLGEPAHGQGRLRAGSPAACAAALPHIDRLVAGHSFAALQQLAEVIAHA